MFVAVDRCENVHRRAPHIVMSLGRMCAGNPAHACIADEDPLSRCLIRKVL